MGYQVKVGISNKHLHLSRKDLDTLFGEGYELTNIKDLGQPGQYACDEVVDIIGPKNMFKNIRILGPVRPETQVELAMTDARTLGIKAPMRESGDLAGTPGCKIVGPKGEVEIDHGVIVAQRHIHLHTSEALEGGFTNGQIVSIKLGDDNNRGLIFNNVVVRVSDKYARECHIDTDEGNAAGVGSDVYCEVVED